MDKLRKAAEGYVVVRVLVGILGLTLSVVLHELFHIFMHWGRITHIKFFTNPWSIVEIEAATPPGYDVEGEEMVAYGITLLVIFITTVIIFRIKDSEDKRSTKQILFPGDKDMQKLDPSEMLELSELDEPEAIVSRKAATKRRKL